VIWQILEAPTAKRKRDPYCQRQNSFSAMYVASRSSDRGSIMSCNQNTVGENDDFQIQSLKNARKYLANSRAYVIQPWLLLIINRKSHVVVLL